MDFCVLVTLMIQSKKNLFSIFVFFCSAAFVTFETEAAPQYFSRNLPFYSIPYTHPRDLWEYRGRWGGGGRGGWGSVGRFITSIGDGFVQGLTGGGDDMY